MGDYGNRNNANANGTANNSSSGGNNNWSSPRWAANNPQAQQPQNGTQPATNGTSASTATNATNGSNGAVQQGGTQANGQPAPWSNNAQNATVQQGGSTVTAAQPGVQPQAQACEDNRPRALDLPGDTCARPCRAAWQRCFDGCNNGQDRGCVATCDDTFRECMRGCY